MKTVQTVKKIMAVMGLSPNHRGFNSRQIIFVIVCAVNVILLVFYIFLVANTIDEYIDAMFSFTVLVGITIAFISLTFKNDEIFTVIKFCEKELTESKCQCQCI